MGFIRITAENIDAKHICCAMSNKQSDKKKDWLRERFDEALDAVISPLRRRGILTANHRTVRYEFQENEFW